MAGDWPESPLTELADLSGGFAFKSGDYAPSGRFVLRTLNIRDDGSISRDAAVYLPEDLCPQYSRFELRPHDTLFVMVGATLGKVGFVRESDLPALLNQNMWLIRARPGIGDPRYVQYAFRYVVKASLGWASGSARDFVRRDDYRNLLIPSPGLLEQRAIAAVLGALDDKIELNRRMNETLEALAQSLFKSWFVDATQSALPKGWRETTLDELATISGGKQLPTEECKPSGRFTVFGANGIMGYADRATHEEFVIAFGRVGAYCGSIHWAYRGAWINNNASSVVPHRWPEFILQAMLNVDFDAMRTGSAQPFIPNSSLSAAKIIRPLDDVLDSYCSIVCPLRLKQNLLDEESRTLAALRDALLPKLLSGELRLPLL